VPIALNLFSRFVGVCVCACVRACVVRRRCLGFERLHVLDSIRAGHLLVTVCRQGHLRPRRSPPLLPFLLLSLPSHTPRPRPPRGRALREVGKGPRLRLRKTYILRHIRFVFHRQEEVVLCVQNELQIDPYASHIRERSHSHPTSSNVCTGIRPEA